MFICFVFLILGLGTTAICLLFSSVVIGARSAIDDEIVRSSSTRNTEETQ